MAVGETFTTFLRETLGHAAKAARDGAIAFVCMDWRHMGELLAAGERPNGQVCSVALAGPTCTPQQRPARRRSEPHPDPAGSFSDGTKDERMATEQHFRTPPNTLGPDDLRVAATAFEAALARFHQATTYITPHSAHQALAVFIIDQALSGERDVARLRDDALRLLGIGGQVASP
jgi:hypothetical protein